MNRVLYFSPFKWIFYFMCSLLLPLLLLLLLSFIRFKINLKVLHFSDGGRIRSFYMRFFLSFCYTWICCVDNKAAKQLTLTRCFGMWSMFRHAIFNKITDEQFSSSLSLFLSRSLVYPPGRTYLQHLKINRDSSLSSLLFISAGKNRHCLI